MMKSHTAQFGTADLLRIVAGPLAVAVGIAAVLHLGVRAGVLPAPRPTLDTDRTILMHQADAARAHPPVDVVLVGDSSCLMNVSAAHLGQLLGRSVLNLGTLSYLDPAAYGRLLGEFTRRHAPKAVVLLMHPEALRRLGSENHHLTVLNQYLAGHDDSRPGGSSGSFNHWAGVDLVQGRLISRWIPAPLRGAYGAYYGFSWDLEKFMTRHGGSAVDPGAEKMGGRTEYRLAPTLEKASREFRQAVPAKTRLWVGLTPVPASVAPSGFVRQRDELLETWASWLEPSSVLTNLPPTLPEEAFARATHLKPGSVTNYTERLATALQPAL